AFGPGWLIVTWSLAVEEQFYLVLPLLIRVTPARAWPYVFLACAAAALPLRIVAVHAWGPFAIFLFPCRMDSLFLGVFAAWLLRQRRGRRAPGRRPRAFAAAIGILALGLAPLTGYTASFSTINETVGISWIAIFYTAVLLALVTSQRAAVF